jgi:hypothetical protein
MSSSSGRKGPLMILIRSLWTWINFKVRRVMILEMRWREVRSRTSRALSHKGNAGGSGNSSSMNGKGGGQGAGHKVSTFYIKVTDKIDGGRGAATPKGSQQYKVMN